MARLTAQEMARLVVEHFQQEVVNTSRGPYSQPVVMMAIAKAESGWNANSQGDFGIEVQYGECNGYTSWGLWQIHNVHGNWIKEKRGLTTPCDWARWLYNPDNNAETAKYVRKNQGFGAWNVYNTGAYLRYLEECRIAVDAIKSEVQPPSFLPPPFDAVPAWAGVALLAGTGIVGAAMIGAWYAAERKAR